MSSDRGFTCSECGQTHQKQVFISHAKADEAIAKRVAEACCGIGVCSYLFEFSPEFNTQTPPAGAIARQIAASDAIFVLLGQSVSDKFWTQAWIGYEIGVFTGVELAAGSLGQGGYGPKKVIVIQDVHQGIKVAVPRLDALFLFDFDSDRGWEKYQGLVGVLTGIGESLEFFKAGNRFREYAMQACVKCDNSSCKSEYEAWIAIEDADNLANPCLTVSGPGLPFMADCTIDCPSCDCKVSRCFRRML